MSSEVMETAIERTSDLMFGMDSLQQELFLNSSKVLSRDEKIQYYDQLKEKYEEMLALLTDYETKADYLERQGKEMEQVKKTKVVATK